MAIAVHTSIAVRPRVLAVCVLALWTIPQAAVGAASSNDLATQIQQRQLLACKLAQKAILLLFRAQGADGVNEYPVLNEVAGRCESDRDDGYQFKPALAGEAGAAEALRKRLQLLDRQIDLLNELIATLESEESGASA
jgi:hypothetical protein